MKQKKRSGKEIMSKLLGKNPGLRIDLGENLHNTKVYFNDEEIAVTSLEIISEANNFTKIKLEIIADNNTFISAQGVFKVDQTIMGDIEWEK